MAASTDRALTVFAWGNESRGDDAVGAVLARRLCGLAHRRIEVIEDHQLHIEHVMDLDGACPALFIDASVAIDSDYRLDRIEPGDDGSLSTHAMSPPALLALYERTLGKQAPAAYLLHVRASQFGLGEPLSEATSGRIDKAWKFLEQMLASEPAQWQDLLETASYQAVS